MALNSEQTLWTAVPRATLCCPSPDSGVQEPALEGRPFVHTRGLCSGPELLNRAARELRQDLLANWQLRTGS